MTIRQLALVLCCLALSLSALAQSQEVERGAMQKYVIERDLPGAGKLSAGELQATSKKSREVLQNMGTKIQWVQSYVTDDKIYCVYLARTRPTSAPTRRRAGSRLTAYRASRRRSIQPARIEAGGGAISMHIARQPTRRPYGGRRRSPKGKSRNNVP